MSVTTYPSAHDLTNCHDVRHNGPGCPSCDGVKITCRTHQTPSTDAGTSHPAEATEAGNPGGGGRTSPYGSPRPDATQRVTWNGPLTAAQDVTDDSWTVAVTLAGGADTQHVKDLYHHRALLISYFEVQQQAEDKRLDTHERADAREIATALEHRLAGAFRSSDRPVTQWVLTPLQAEALLDQLEDANAEPEACAVGTCDANAIDGGSYCAPHEDVL